MRIILAGFAFFLVFPLFCRADVIHLKDGKSIEGDVLSLDETEVRVLLPYGRLTVARADVLRIDFGELQVEPEKEEGIKTEPIEPEEEKVETPVEPTMEGEEPPAQLQVGKERKNPTTAAALAVLPGGGYAYLDRWDLAVAAAGLEVGLLGWGMSLVNQEDEGNRSTGYVVLGFIGLLKVAEIFDSYDRALEWNKALGLALDTKDGSFRLGVRASLLRDR
jgi:hypothetical protein